MVVISQEVTLEVIRLGAVDILLTDLHYWEGPRGVKDLAAVCRTFNLGVAMHSGAEFGVELAAMLCGAVGICRT